MNTFSKRIAIDLVPMLPGAENGGLKILANELLTTLPKIAPEIQWVLLTADDTHEEIEQYEGPNVVRLCVLQRKGGVGGSSASFRLRTVVKAMLPARGRHLLKKHCRKSFPKDRAKILKEKNISLLFCPFMTPVFVDPDIPLVSIVPDLQSLSYPMFFSPGERLERELNYKRIFNQAQGIITISHFVKRTILERFEYPASNIRVIAIQTAKRLPLPSIDRMSLLAETIKICKNKYFVYPANAWPHKNHRMLFVAWGMLQKYEKFQDIKLVCTAENNKDIHLLKNEVKDLNLENKICFPGFLSDADLSSLLAYSSGLIFPSLYEGFGMPIIEAMRMGIPVLCSDCSSLPEVGGDAILMFDARKPQTIVKSLIQIITTPSLRIQLQSKGSLRAEQYSDSLNMARNYLNFLLAIATK